MARFWSSQICVMPTFSPTIAFFAMASYLPLQFVWTCICEPEAHAEAPHGWVPGGAFWVVMPRRTERTGYPGRRSGEGETRPAHELDEYSALLAVPRRRRPGAA